MLSRCSPSSCIVALVLALGLLGFNHATDLMLHAQGPGVSLSFADITAVSGFNNTVTGSHGAMFADVTQDGLPDLYLTYNDFYKGYRQNYFYRNLGGTFIEEAAARGIDVFSIGTHGAAWADLDNDGDYDLAVALTYGTTDVPIPEAEHNRLYRNNGGIFADATPPAMAAYEDYTRSLLTLDWDRDGDLDVYAVNGDQGDREAVPCCREEAYRNDGGFQFTAIASGPLITTQAGQGATDTDYDGDGDVDIIAANRNGVLTILRNNGSGSFTAVNPASIGISHTAGSGVTSADMDNDGDFDLILLQQNFAVPAERIAYVYRNVGGGTFAFHAQIFGVGGFTAGVADLDNDRDLDLVLPGYPVVLVNDGNFGFSGGPPFGGPATGFPTPDPRTVAFSDIDGDGDLDMALTAKDGPAYLIRNNLANGGRWLKVRLIAPNGQLGAFGAKVRVRTVNGGPLLGIREAKSSSGYLAQDDTVLHFGLGNASTVDVQVTFLNGTQVALENVSSNQTITVGGDGGSGPGLPGAPRNLTMSVVGSAVTFNWDAASGGGAPTQYILEAGSFSGGSNLAIVPTGSTSRTFAASAPPGLYYVRVKGSNGAGVGPPSNEVVVQVGGTGVPQAPVGLTFSKSGSLVTLQWSPPAGGVSPSAYIIEAGSQSGLANLAMIDVGLATFIQAVAPNGTYYVRIRARNAVGTSPPSNEVVIQLP